MPRQATRAVGGQRRRGPCAAGPCYPATLLPKGPHALQVHLMTAACVRVAAYMHMRMRMRMRCPPCADCLATAFCVPVVANKTSLQTTAVTRAAGLHGGDALLAPDRALPIPAARASRGRRVAAVRR